MRRWLGGGCAGVLVNYDLEVCTLLSGICETESTKVELFFGTAKLQRLRRRYVAAD